MFRRRGRGIFGGSGIDRDRKDDLDLELDEAEPQETDEDESAGVEGELDEGEAEDSELESGELDEDEPEDTNADLDRQAADYLADNDTWLYGPNAADVLDILERLDDLGPEQGEVIANAWLAVPKSDRDAARKEVRKIVEREDELSRQVSMAREEVGSWMSVAAEYPEFRGNAEWPRTCSRVGEAAFDAVTAIILEEELEEEHYLALFGPWSDAMDELAVEEEVEEFEGEDEVETAGPSGEEEGEFGPNSNLVLEFLSRLWLVTPEQVTRLVGAWENSPADELDLAHQALHELVDEDEYSRDQIHRAQDKIAPWLNGGRLEETAGFMGQSGAGTTRRMAGPALADAVAALVVGDLLVREDAEMLYAPWYNVVGVPELPEPATEAPPTAKGSGKASGAKPAKAEPAKAKPAKASPAKAAAAKTLPVKPAPVKPAPAKAAPAKPTAGATQSSGARPAGGQAPKRASGSIKRKSRRR